MEDHFSILEIPASCECGLCQADTIFRCNACRQWLADCQGSGFEDALCLKCWSEANNIESPPNE